MITLLAVTGCVAAPDAGGPTDRLSAPAVALATPAPLELQPRTVLPEKFSVARPPTEKRKILIPRPLVELECVKAKSIGLREGPGMQFGLRDQLLGQGDCAIITHKVGIWAYAIAYRQPVVGWIHQEALQAPQSQESQALPDKLPVREEDLPTVFTRNVIKYAYDHPTRQSASVSIPKGIRFPLLLAGKEYALLWIPQTNSVMWLKIKELDIGL